MPERIQLSRRKGFRLPAGAEKVDRTTPYGNPFLVGKGRTREQAVGEYRALVNRLDYRLFREMVHRHLRGKTLACWCPLDQPCHADVLLEIANREEQPPAAAYFGHGINAGSPADHREEKRPTPLEIMAQRKREEAAA